MTQATKTYVRDFVIAMAAYVVALFSVVSVIPRLDGSPWRFALAVLPVVPVGLGMAIFIRWLGKMDELQQRIQLSGIAFAASSVGLLSFTYGFLEGMGFPHLSWIWILPATVMLWGLGTAVASRRYQ